MLRLVARRNRDSCSLGVIIARVYISVPMLRCIAQLMSQIYAQCAFHRSLSPLYAPPAGAHPFHLQTENQSFDNGHQACSIRLLGHVARSQDTWRVSSNHVYPPFISFRLTQLPVQSFPRHSLLFSDRTAPARLSHEFHEHHFSQLSVAGN